MKGLQGDSAAVGEDLEEINVWLNTDTDKRDTLDLSIGFNLNLLSSSAWDVAKLNQSLTYLENEKVQAISGVYETQEFYERTGREVFDAMINLVKLDDENTTEYKQELVAFRFKMRLVSSAIQTFNAVARNFLLKYPPIPSEQGDQ